MRVHIRTRKLEEQEAKLGQERAQHRLHFALDRFAPILREVRVTLEDINGPRGGVDKSCRLKLTFSAGGEPLLASALESDLATAIDVACDTLARSVARRVETRRILNRSR